MTEDRFAELMVKVVDEVATASEKEELMSHIIDKPELRKELDMHRTIKAASDGWVSRLDADLTQDRTRSSALITWGAGIGLFLFGMGLAVLTGGGVYTVMAAPDIPVWVQIGTGLVSAGTVGLTVLFVGWRMLTRKSDPYTEVVR